MEFPLRFFHPQAHPLLCQAFKTRAPDDKVSKLHTTVFYQKLLTGTGCDGVVLVVLACLCDVDSKYTTFCRRFSVFLASSCVYFCSRTGSVVRRRHHGVKSRYFVSCGAKIRFEGENRHVDIHDWVRVFRKLALPRKAPLVPG